MCRDHAFELLSRHGFFEIVRSAKVHGLEITVHVQAARNYHHRSIPVACQSELHKMVRFKGRAALTDHYEVKVLIFQASLRLQGMNKSTDRVAHASQ